MSRQSILIAGAGIGGLTLANALEGTECAIEIAERSATSDANGFGIVLHPNGLEVLARLSLMEEIEAASQVIRRIEILRGEAKLTIPLSEVWKGTAQPTRALLRSDLHRILWRGAVKSGQQSPRARMNCPVVNVELRDLSVFVHFGDGTSKAYDLIVGADGVHSSLRQALLPESASASTHLFYFRWLAKNVIHLKQDIWEITEQPDYSYGFIPLNGNRVHCFVQLKTASVPCAQGEELSWLERAFHRSAPVLVQMLLAREGAIHADFGWVAYPPRWSIGRCVFVGDSAHAVSPMLSEGGSLAMEDAIVLAAALRHSGSIPEAIERYRSAREERIAWVARMSQAQLRSLRRISSQLQTSSEIATNHLRSMYEPLCSSPLPNSLPFSSPKAELFSD